jgi:hypothetical protein
MHQPTHLFDIRNRKPSEWRNINGCFAPDGLSKETNERAKNPNGIQGMHILEVVDHPANERAIAYVAIKY